MLAKVEASVVGYRSKSAGEEDISQDKKMLKSLIW